MTEMQSAIGRVALRKVPAWIDTRRRYATILNQELSSVPGLRTTIPGPEVGHAYYKYYVFMDRALLNKKWDRDRIMQAVNDAGIPCFSGSCSEIYLEAAFPAEWRPANRLPIARELGETSLMFLVHPTLTEQNIRETARVLEDIMQVAVA
jgi:dTDP-4-amino-4,6-dideoxygalactose transaminase